MSISAGEAGVRIEASDTEGSARIDDDLRSGELVSEHRHEHVLPYISADIFLRDCLRMLHADDNGRDDAVGDGHLGLAVRKEPWEFLLHVRSVERFDDLCAEHDAERKEFRSLTSSVAVHDALVACAVAVNAAGYLRRLGYDAHNDLYVAREADRTVDLAGNGLVIHCGSAGHFPAYRKESVAAEAFYGHAGVWILREVCVEEGVRDLIAHLVRMSAADVFHCVCLLRKHG